ncbi:YxeA family protein [Bacillus sp. DX1.1]|uniref:YxeA family protein n=1 Tax=unclassified Bacillus (in: firmicutes) TaxID=185979 RepID=UPI00256FF8AC|nr:MULTISPECIES: YxeA family protein [unclassified Bacillus (in: firmicutes)]MDM5157481.1 YxeA family protein [Bacillus sp. DX1.1]WJE81700.1 YxeA family protein [Bacillus sp. DX3.1]
MKLVIRVLAVFAILLGGTAFYLHSKTEGVQAFVDNFFSNKEIQDYYAVINKGEKKDDEYLYTFTGYSEDGKQQIIRKMINRKLHPGAFIKIYAKGTQGKGWAEVSKENIPEKALKKLQKS